jgi:hypothetical protein
MFHRAQVHRVHRQPIKRVSRQRDHIAALQRLDNLPNQMRLRLVRMNAKHFSVQN